MSHRTLRNAGAASITALALALVACGGSSSTSTPVTPANNAPTVVGVSGTYSSMVTKHTYQYTISATDKDGDTLTYTVAPTGGAATIAGNVVTIVPTAAGTLPVYTVTVSDGKGGTATQALPATPVTADIEPADQNLGNQQVGTKVNYTLLAVDGDGDNYVYTKTTGGTLADAAVILTGNVINIDTNGLTLNTPVTTKLSVQQKSNGQNVGTAKVVTLTVTPVIGLNQYPNFVGNQIPTSPFYIRHGNTSGSAIGTSSLVEKPAAPAKLITLVANDADADTMLYTIQWVNKPANTDGRFFSSASAADAFATKLGTGATLLDIEPGQIPYQTTATGLYTATLPTNAVAVPANQPVDLFFVATQTNETDGNVVSARIRMLATDKYNQYDPNGYVFDAALTVKDNTAPLWSPYTSASGLATVPAPSSTATATTVTTVEGTNALLTWNPTAGSPAVANMWDQADGTVGDYPVAVISGSGFVGALNTNSLTAASSVLTWNWTPAAGDAWSQKSFTLTLRDATGKTKAHSVTVNVNGILHAYHKGTYVLDKANDATNDSWTSWLASGSAGANNYLRVYPLDTNSSAPYMAGLTYPTTGLGNEATLTNGSPNAADAQALLDVKNLPNGVPGGPGYAYLFDLVGINGNTDAVYTTLSRNPVPNPLIDVDMQLWSRGRENDVPRNALNTGLTTSGSGDLAAPADGAFPSHYIRFGATGLTAWDEAKDTFGVFVPNHNAAGYYGKLATTTGAQLNATTQADCVSNFPVVGALTGSNVTLDWDSLPGTQYLWEATGAASSAAGATVDADQGYVAQMREVTNGSGATALKAMKQLGGAPLPVKNMVNSGSPMITDFDAVLNFAPVAAADVKVKVDRDSFYGMRTSVHGVATNITGISDSFDVYGVLDAATGPVTDATGAPAILKWVSGYTQPTGAYDWTVPAVSNLFAGMTAVTEYHYNTTITMTAYDGTNNLSLSAGFHTFATGMGFDTAHKMVVPPVLNPRIKQLGGTLGLNPFLNLNDANHAEVAANAATEFSWTFDATSAGSLTKADMSGVVVEFYNIAAGAPATQGALYKRVIVAPGLEGTNNIAKVILPANFFVAGDYVVRYTQVRTLNGGTLINFGKTPYKLGYPMYAAEAVGIMRVN